MADYTRNKETVGQHEPDNAIDASFSRFGPLITAPELRRRFLWGIPLVSPVTGQKLSDEDIEEYILDAVSELENELSLQIFPTQHKERQPFDRNEYAAMGYMRLRNRPVQSVQALRIATSNDMILWEVNTDWIDAGYMSTGLIYIVPINIASAPSTSGAAAGGAAFLALLGQQSWVPAFWQVVYTTGFKEGNIPRNFNILIGCQAAIGVLNALAQANARNGSKSLGVGGLSQSSSNPGPDIYKPAIEALTLRKTTLVGRIKAQYGSKLFSGNV